MYIPKKLKPYFNLIDSKGTTATILHGQIKCCSESSFDVLYYGCIKKSVLGHLTIGDFQDGLIIILRCKKCGQEIELFNSFTDGYERCIEKKSSYNIDRFLQLYCSKNDHSNFAVEVTFEYPPKEELSEDNITVFENAFSWIWITIKCNSCKKIFKNIVNYETS